MTATDVIDITIDATDVKSVSAVAGKTVDVMQDTANRRGCGHKFDKRKMKNDMIILLAERDIVNLEELEISFLEDGTAVFGETVTGRRVADLIIRYHYVSRSSRYENRSNRRNV